MNLSAEVLAIIHTYQFSVTNGMSYAPPLAKAKGTWIPRMPRPANPVHRTRAVTGKDYPTLHDVMRSRIESRHCCI